MSKSQRSKGIEVDRLNSGGLGVLSGVTSPEEGEGSAKEALEQLSDIEGLEEKRVPCLRL